MENPPESNSFGLEVNTVLFIIFLNEGKKDKGFGGVGRV